MTHVQLGERGQRCLRNQPTGEHHWKPGPAVSSTIGLGDTGQYVLVTHVAIVCECGAVAVRKVPPSSDG